MEEVNSRPDAIDDEKYGDRLNYFIFENRAAAG